MLFFFQDQTDTKTYFLTLENFLIFSILQGQKLVQDTSKDFLLASKIALLPCFSYASLSADYNSGY